MARLAFEYAGRPSLKLAAENKQAFADAVPDKPAGRALLEQMAQREHERRVAEKLRTGWRHSPQPPDVDKKLHPSIVAWSELPDDVKDYDRNAMRAIPDVLAEAGYRIFPVAGA